MNTPIGAKVAHVKDASQTRMHCCHWPGCETQVAPALWGCRTHWYTLPKPLRDRIWRTYAPGQEITQRPSREYIEAARAVQEWIAQRTAAEGAAYTAVNDSIKRLEPALGRRPTGGEVSADIARHLEEQQTNQPPRTGP